MKPVRYHFDRLILWYLGITFAVSFFGSYFGWGYLLTALAHALMILLVLRITKRESVWGVQRWLRWLYPLLLLIPLHYEIELMGTLFHAGRTFDDLVLLWDGWIFGAHPHKYLQDILPGPVWLEVLHAFYLSYYFIIIGGFLRVLMNPLKRGLSTQSENDTPSILRFTFVYMGTFCTYMASFILFPVVGPLDDRFLGFHGTGLLPGFVDWIYAAGDSAGGAMPSSHVGEALVIYLLLRPRQMGMRILFLTLIAGMTLSTVYGSFHYAVDAIGGLITGPLFYLLWSWVYSRLPHEERQVAAQEVAME